MDREPHYNADGLIIESPVISIETKQGPLEFTWANSTLRIFEDPHGHADYTLYNHIEYECEDGSKVGIRVPQEVLDSLFEANFPMLSMPFPDRSTVEWFVRMETKELDREIDYYLGEVATTDVEVEQPKGGGSGEDEPKMAASCDNCKFTGKVQCDCQKAEGAN